MELPSKKPCARCKNSTNRHATAKYCWLCQPIVDTENRHAREKKKKSKLKREAKKLSLKVASW